MDPTLISIALATLGVRYREFPSDEPGWTKLRAEFAGEPCRVLGNEVHRAAGTSDTDHEQIMRTARAHLVEAVRRELTRRLAALG